MLHGRRRVLLQVLLLAGAIAMAYGNGLNAGWQYDDYSNIVDNPRVRLARLSWQGLVAAMYDDHPQHPAFSRPLVRLSFALNYRLGGYDPFGYRLVNLAIHLACALLIWRLLARILAHGSAGGALQKAAGSIGWLAALIWAVHPIQVTAVTVIVQRMAAMAAMFYLAAMVSFLEAGRRRGRRRRCWLAATAVFALAAAGCKENAFMLPASLAVMELVIEKRWDRRGLLRAAGWLAVLVAAAAVVFFLQGGIEALARDYAHRPYTMGQRLLTQPRVLWSYLGLLAWPTYDRLCLLHELQLSAGWWQPPQTLVAAIALVLAVGFSLFLCRRRPVAGFCLVFFFLNHAIEASFLSLEPIYEHRNYLPSALIFFFPAVGSWWAVQRLGRIRPAWKAVVAAVVVVVIAAQVHTTRMYNRVFANELTLWMDVVRKSPGLSLAHNNLGKVLYNAGLVEKARQHFLQAQELDRFYDLRQRAMIHHNLGLYALEVAGDPQEAYRCFEQALQIASGVRQTWRQLGRAALALKRPATAEEIFRQALSIWPGDCDLQAGRVAALMRLPQRQHEAVALAAAMDRRCGADALEAVCRAALASADCRVSEALAAWHRALEQGVPACQVVTGALSLMNCEPDANTGDALVRQVVAWGDRCGGCDTVLAYVNRQKGREFDWPFRFKATDAEDQAHQLGCQ